MKMENKPRETKITIPLLSRSRRDYVWWGIDLTDEWAPAIRSNGLHGVISLLFQDETLATNAFHPTLQKTTSLAI